MIAIFDIVSDCWYNLKESNNKSLTVEDYKHFDLVNYSINFKSRNKCSHLVAL